jgi:hypothetical protein
MTEAINPFESSDQAADMYRKDQPHMFIEFREDHYLLQGISNGETVACYPVLNLCTSKKIRCSFLCKCSHGFVDPRLC